MLFTFQYLLGQLLVSEERAEELERSGEQLRHAPGSWPSLQVGVLSALLHTLDLRDRMTARHCAAVARYSREIALAAGFSEEEQELVHTAGLLHDIGKFIFPDRILKGGTKLTEEDWQIIKMHPYQGAKVVARWRATAPSARSSWPTTSASTARATRAAWRATRSPRCRASSRSPTPMT